MNLTNKILSLENISKTYYTLKDETKVLDNISFDIYENDFIGLIGPSGCGKSTILNIICDLDKNYQGRIIKNKNIKIGYMLQEHALFDWKNVLDNALIGLKITNNLTKENKEYVISLLNKYGLKDYINKYPNELSGGMKQRVGRMQYTHK